MYANPVILGGLFSNGKYGGMWLMENGLRRTSGPVHAKLSIRYMYANLRVPVLTGVGMRCSFLSTLYLPRGRVTGV